MATISVSNTVAVAFHGWKYFQYNISIRNMPNRHGSSLAITCRVANNLTIHEFELKIQQTGCLMKRISAVHLQTTDYCSLWIPCRPICHYWKAPMKKLYYTWNYIICAVCAAVAIMHGLMYNFPLLMNVIILHQGSWVYRPQYSHSCVKLLNIVFGLCTYSLYLVHCQFQILYFFLSWYLKS